MENHSHRGWRKHLVRILILNFLFLGFSAFPQQPAAPSGTSAPLTPVSPVVKISPQTNTSLISIPETKVTIPWEAVAKNQTAGGTFWRNGLELPFEGRNVSWGSFELLNTGPGGMILSFSGPPDTSWTLSMDPYSQAWWMATQGGMGNLELFLPSGNIQLKAQGTRDNRGVIKAQDLTINFQSASLILIQEVSGDFLLVCQSGILDVSSLNYKFRMLPQRAYERINDHPRYFEVPFQTMGKTIQEWKNVAKSQSLIPLAQRENLTTELGILEQDFRTFQGWGGELQYWFNRILTPPPLTQEEKNNALLRLNPGVTQWTNAVGTREILAARWDRLLKNNLPADKKLLDTWKAQRSRWHNLLSQFRFAWGIYNQLQAPIKLIVPPVPTSTPSSHTNTLKDLTDPTALLKNLLETINTDSTNP